MTRVLQETWPEGGHFHRHDGDMTNSLTSTDPRASFAQAVVTLRGVVDGIAAEQLSSSTPCPDHDVRSLLGHTLTVFRRLSALGNATDPMAMPDVVTGIDDQAWPAEFLAAAHEVQAAWTDAAKLDQPMVLPWATAPGAAMVAMYTAELTVHTWDLAVATGQSPIWHEPTVQVALASALQALPPGDREAYFAEMAKNPAFGPELADRPPFRNAVSVADTAPALDRLIGWYGRQPGGIAS
jgi:uncharacterized protein (TIGR03086 family)